MQVSQARPSRSAVPPLRGPEVRGLFHWTAVDNYEWYGYDVSFGIIDRDRNVRPSARVLQREARA